MLSRLEHFHLLKDHLLITVVQKSTQIQILHFRDRHQALSYKNHHPNLHDVAQTVPNGTAKLKKWTRFTKSTKFSYPKVSVKSNYRMRFVNCGDQLAHKAVVASSKKAHNGSGL